VDIVAQSGVERGKVLQAAATAEALSEHSIAEAVRETARQAGISFSAPDKFDYVPGRGVIVTSEGDVIIAGNRSMMIEFGVPGPLPQSQANVTEILVAKNGELLGMICISDSLRPEAVEAIRALKKAGLETILLSGDAHSSVQHTVAELGFDKVESDLLPVQKSDYVARLTGSGKVVAMLGDGINDAPALRRASIGVAMGSGTDIARESADALLLGDDLGKFVETLLIARRCRRIIMTNFIGTLLVDTVGVGLAAFGYLNPLLAVTIHVTSELAFILNSARLLPRRS